MSSSSVRPITTSEAIHAHGEPLTSFMTFFGLTQGILAHMNYHKLTIHSKTWFPTAHSRVFGLMFIGGGLVTGRLAGQFLFGVPEL